MNTSSPLSEIELQKLIVETLNYSGCLVWRVNVGLIKIENKGNSRWFRSGVAGSSDIQGLQKNTGRFIGLEVKLPGKGKKSNPTSLQQQFLDNVKEAGGIAGCARSVEDAQEIIKSS